MSTRGDARFAWWTVGASAAALLVSSHVWAQTAAPQRGLVYTCVDASGKRLSSDRLILQCADRDQRVLNADGSLNHIESPALTADERADAEAREREASAERVARLDAMRRDRNLMHRFPNEAAHQAAREKALDDIRSAIKLSETRINALLVERKPLLDEAEFYVGKTMPPKLRNAVEANEASLSAQRSLMQNQPGEVVRINALYDSELARLKRLWAGAQPGSMGPAASATTPVKSVLAPPPSMSRPEGIATTSASGVTAKASLKAK